MADDFKIESLPPGQRDLLVKNPNLVKQYQDNPNKQTPDVGGELKIGGKEQDAPVRLAKENADAAELTSNGDKVLEDGKKVEKEADNKYKSDDMKVHQNGLKNAPVETNQMKTLNPQIDAGEGDLKTSGQQLIAFSDEANKEVEEMDEEIEVINTELEAEEELRAGEEESIADLTSQMENLPAPTRTRGKAQQANANESQPQGLIAPIAIEGDEAGGEEGKTIGGEIAAKTDSVNERLNNIDNLQITATGFSDRIQAVQTNKINIVTNQTTLCEQSLQSANDKSKKATKTMVNGGIVIGASVAAGAGLAAGGTALVSAAAAEYGIATPLTATCSPMLSNPFTAAAGIAGLAKSGILFSAGTVKVSAGALMALASPIVTYGGTLAGTTMVVAGGISKGKANKLTQTATSELNQSKAFDEKLSKDLEKSLNRIPA